MSHRLIDLNGDLQRLRHDGFNIDIHAGHLVVRDIPYVNSKREIKRGIFAAPLDLNGDILNRPSSHQMRFAGECPCDAAGQPLNGISPAVDAHRISDKLSTDFHFSAMHSRGHYLDYYEKVRTYSAILSGHAAAIDPTVTSLTFAVVEPVDDGSPFQYIDTASARAGINVITQKLGAEKIAIVGLGGTGAYVLDLLSKVPIREIHLFDGDKFSSHNAFRSPGAASKEELHRQPLKVSYLSSVYSKLHRGIVAHDEYVDESNVQLLKEMNFVFLCVDAGPGKKLIVEKLEEFDIAFIDVGIGLWAKDESLGGTVRATTSLSDGRKAARARMSLLRHAGPNEYEMNIQIADLNALNATLAVIRWKKIRGFYRDFKDERHSTYTIGSNMLLSEDIHEQN